MSDRSIAVAGPTCSLCELLMTQSKLMHPHTRWPVCLGETNQRKHNGSIEILGDINTYASILFRLKSEIPRDLSKAQHSCYDCRTHCSFVSNAGASFDLISLFIKLFFHDITESERNEMVSEKSHLQLYAVTILSLIIGTIGPCSSSLQSCSLSRVCWYLLMLCTYLIN